MKSPVIYVNAKSQQEKKGVKVKEGSHVVHQRSTSGGHETSDESKSKKEAFIDSPN